MNVKKKYILIIPTSRLGGAEKLLKNITLYLLNTNTDVEVHILKKVCSSWSDIADKCTVRYYSDKNVFLGLFNFLFSIKFTVNNYLFSSHVLTNCLFGLLKRYNKKKELKLICRESTDVFYRYSGLKLLYYKFLYYISYSSIDLLIFQTTRMQGSFKLNIFKKLQSLNTMVIPNPIILKSNEVDVIPEMLNSKYIVAAGRLIKEKGFDLLIKAFNEFYKINKDYKLIILGEGKERGDLQKIINKLKLEKVVVLYGKVDNPLNYFKTAEICIVSSRVEGFPNVLLEMMSQNTKVISTLCAGDIDKIKGVVTVKINSIKETLNALLDISISDTVLNRELFDEELKKRTIESYFLIIENKFKEVLNL